jgi:hypothetical protein
MELDFEEIPAGDDELLPPPPSVPFLPDPDPIEEDALT